MKKELRGHPALRLPDAALWRHSRSSARRARRRCASLVEEGREAVASGRPGHHLSRKERGSRSARRRTLKSGFAALYRALGLPVVPVALDSGRLWGRGFVHRSGTVTIKVGETIPPGLPREEIEARVHAAINALELGAEACA